MGVAGPVRGCGAGPQAQPAKRAERWAEDYLCGPSRGEAAARTTSREVATAQPCVGSGNERPRSQRRGRHHTSAIFRAYSLSVCPRQSDCASSRCGSQPPGLRLRQKSCQPGAAPMRRAESLTPHGLDSLPPPAPGAARHSNRTAPSWWYHRAKPAEHARHRAGLHRGWFQPDTNGKPFALSQTRVGSYAQCPAAPVS